jgi:hypothetical protein
MLRFHTGLRHTSDVLIVTPPQWGPEGLILPERERGE